MTPSKLLPVSVLLWSLLSVAPVAHAAPILVTIDTSARSGSSARLAFELIDGGEPANSVAISNFSTDGTLGAASSTGNVTGTLPGTVNLFDTSFFTEYLQDITLGTTISFVMDDTTAVPSTARRSLAWQFTAASLSYPAKLIP